MRGLCLRLCEPRDFPAIARLTNEFIEHTAVHFGYQPVAAGELEQTWRQTIELYPWLCAEVDGAFAGYAKASNYRGRTAYQWTAETTIYLHAARRGSGLGRLLYGRLIAVLAAQGFRSLIGGISLPNPASVALHEKLGFVACGVTRDAGWKHDRWHDVGFWQLRLQTGDAPAEALRTPAAAFAATSLAPSPDCQ